LQPRCETEVGRRATKGSAVKVRSRGRSMEAMRTRTALVAAAVLAVSACSVDVPVAADAGESTGVAPLGTEASSESGSTEGGVVTGGTHGPNDTSSSDAAGSEDDGPKLDLEVPETTGPLDDCADVSKQILVLATNEAQDPLTQEVHRFVMESATFELVTVLDESCDLSNVNDGDHSMAVDRAGIAYTPTPNPTHGGLGGLYALDLNAANASCTELATAPPFASTPGLAFVGTDPMAPSMERLLYKAAGPAGALGWLDLGQTPAPTTAIAVPAMIGPLIAGTVDERLFAIAYAGGGAGDLVRLSPDDGSIVQTLTSLDDATQHLAFYAGDIVLFDALLVATNAFVPTVRRYDLDDDDGNGEHELEVLVDVDDGPPGLRIRGVASSTCVPLTPAG